MSHSACADSGEADLSCSKTAMFGPVADAPRWVCFWAVGAPCPLLDRASSHDALEILKPDPAAEFSGPNPNRRRPSQLDQLGISVPAPDRHGGDAKLFLHLRIGDKRVVAGVSRVSTRVASVAMERLPF